MKHQVQILTPGQHVTLDNVSAEALESLMFDAENGSREDVHRFTLCFERAVNGVFFMPGAFWLYEFEKRIGRLLKASGIRLAAGTPGAKSQWEIENLIPSQGDRPKRSRRNG